MDVGEFLKRIRMYNCVVEYVHAYIIIDNYTYYQANVFLGMCVYMYTNLLESTQLQTIIMQIRTDK